MKYLRIAILFVTASFITAQATTYYVSPAGNNSNPGSATLPFLTIQRAATVVEPGDVYNIGTGTYRETVTPGANNVTFQAAPGAAVVVSGYELVTN